MSESKAPVVVHHVGKAVRATLPNGVQVERQEGFFVREYNWAYVRADPDEDHFIYHSTELGPAYMCTCGSQAVIVGHKFENGELYGGLWVCYHKATTGNHTNLQAIWT